MPTQYRRNSRVDLFRELEPDQPVVTISDSQRKRLSYGDPDQPSLMEKDRIKL